MIAILTLENHGRTTYKASNVPDPARIEASVNIKAYAEVAAGDRIVRIDYPRQALTLRQPWGWAIVHAGKDVENRSRRICPPGWYFLHVGQGGGESYFNDSIHFMTQPTAEEGIPAVAKMNIPKYSELPRGGVIAAMKFGEWITESPSRWFVGPKAVQIQAVVPLPFQAGNGAQGIFAWDHARAFPF